MSPEYSRTDDMVRVALDIGEHMLINGGDITRVEDTVTRICHILDVDHVEVFCIASLLQASVRLKNGEYCFQMRRVKSNGNNMARLEKLNEVSRLLCDRKITFEEAGELIVKANSYEPYRPLFYYLAAVLGSSAFCIFFGGSLRDGLCAAIAAVPVMFLDRHPVRNSTELVHTIVESFIGGITANLLVLAGLGQNVDLVCIGVLMLLIPGVKFGNVMQDFLKADVLAGSAKLVHALLLTLMIVMGLGLSMLVFGRWVL